MVNFFSKSKLILGLFLVLFVFCSVEGLRSGCGCSGTSGKKGLLLFTDLSHVLFVPCVLFVFHVCILVPLEIPCVTSKG